MTPKTPREESCNLSRATRVISRENPVRWTISDSPEPLAAHHFSSLRLSNPGDVVSIISDDSEKRRAQSHPHSEFRTKGVRRTERAVLKIAVSRTEAIETSV